jgi:hypothetical protein
LDYQIQPALVLMTDSAKALWQPNVYPSFRGNERERTRGNIVPMSQLFNPLNLGFQMLSNGELGQVITRKIGI